MRFRPILLLLLPAALFTAGAIRSERKAMAHTLEASLQPGDLLFQHINSPQSEALELATGSYWTHVGIAFREGDRWLVLEAVGPVKSTPLDQWLAQGADGRCVAKRWTGMAAAKEAPLRAAAARFMDLPYDFGFLWSDERIYCSELVWKLYHEGAGIRLCEPQPMHTYDLDHPLVRATMQERYGGQPPLNEPMVAPSTLFACGLLKTVAEV